MSEVEKLAKDIRVFIFVFCVLYTITLIFGMPYGLYPADETDSPDKRSGVNLITDYGTGCQYLQRGGITPRLDSNGNHICNTPSERSE